jgi:hypothetical protein
MAGEIDVEPSPSLALIGAAASMQLIEGVLEPA